MIFYLIFANVIKKIKKMKTLIIGSILFVITSGLFVWWGTSYLTYNNKEIALREQAEAQRKKIEGVHDAMWKIISQKAQISQDYRTSFDSIYTHIISGRYSQGDGTLMKWITESNPTFDTSLYKDLSNAIESERTYFMHTQEKMIDIIREHNLLCKSYPSKWFISNTSEIEYTVISSTHSKEVMKSGEDDDVKLFN